MTEAATRGVLLKKVFLKILQHLQENTCATVSFLIRFRNKSRFSVNLAKSLRAPFSQNTSERLPLA